MWTVPLTAVPGLGGRGSCLPGLLLGCLSEGTRNSVSNNLLELARVTHEITSRFNPRALRSVDSAGHAGCQFLVRASNVVSPQGCQVATASAIPQDCQMVTASAIPESVAIWDQEGLVGIRG